MIELNLFLFCMVCFMGLLNYVIMDVYNGYFEFYFIVNDSDWIIIFDIFNGEFNEWIGVKFIIRLLYLYIKEKSM